MSIPVHQPPEAEGLEPCAVRGPLCLGLARFWTALPDRQAKDQVACCIACSEACRPEEVPSKDDWFKQVRRDARPRVQRMALKAIRRRRAQKRGV